MHRLLIIHVENEIACCTCRLYGYPDSHVTPVGYMVTQFRHLYNSKFIVLDNDYMSQYVIKRRTASLPSAQISSLPHIIATLTSIPVAHRV